MAPDTDTIVVVGGGLSAARVATEYRAAGGEAPVTILSNEQDPPYHRPPLTKGFPVSYTHLTLPTILRV